MKMGMSLKGMGDVTANIEHWKRSTVTKSANAVDESLDEMLSIADRLCPVRSGRLRKSLKKKFDRRTKSGTVGSDLVYAIFVELGTRRMAAQPYLYPAWKQSMAHLKDRLRLAVRV